jgi:regulatory protein YycH of two-component signal transduction system YycFG
VLKTLTANLTYKKGVLALYEAEAGKHINYVDSTVQSANLDKIADKTNGNQGFLSAFKNVLCQSHNSNYRVQDALMYILNVSKMKPIFKN